MAARRFLMSRHALPAQAPASSGTQVQHANTHSPARQLQVIEAEGQRLDNYLRRQLKGVPVGHLQQIIRSGQVRVNGGRVTASHKLHDGDLVRVPPMRKTGRGKPASTAAGIDWDEPTGSRPQGAHAKAASTHLPVLPTLFEDEHLLVLDKPAGVAVHGGSGVSLGVIEQLRAQRQLRFLELVHRLDRDTSGVLVLAKKRVALTRLHAAWRERQPEKLYLALVVGAWSGSASVREPLLRYVNAQGERRVRIDPEGQTAVTQVRVLETFRLSGASASTQSFSLLRLRILTGRTHQIRVHLASQGHPILGDEKYGDYELNRQLARGSCEGLGGARVLGMFLHAEQLTLRHPASDTLMTLRAALPPRFEHLLALLRRNSTPG